jgi:beta-phosphoglucomutase-like phosphatase (HAD superfamily)
MMRVGITPPKVTITADDKRLKAGKPAPDPFLLAAKCLGFNATDCVVFEDSPSGIRSGVASGATVIAVCTSHERSKIESCGAHYIVEDMSQVTCEPIGNGVATKLKFTIRC